MLVPIQHENMSARRWPIITLGLIVINVACFLITLTSGGNDPSELAVTRMHILMLAADHPELTVKPETQQLIESVKERQPGIWRELSSQFRPVEDGWDAQMRLAVDREQWQAEMERLEEEYSRLLSENVIERYGFVPARKSSTSYLTANFLHLGWMHLIGNMWFLWLAGFVLEDAWGRPLYLVFYLLAGAGALQFHAWLHPGSLTTTVGASGAVAGLMGAFLVRFPKIKIEMAWIWIFMFRLRVYRFKIPAYALLPFWVGTEALYGYLFGMRTGVAHWAHVGGFLVGAVFALGIRASGVEKLLTAKVTEKMELAHDPDIQNATELLHTGKAEEAVRILDRYLKREPNSLDGWNLMRQARRRANHIEACREASIRLISLYAAADDMQSAEREFADFVRTSDTVLPPDTWLEFGKGYERQRQFGLAVLEYENLAKAHPNSRECAIAQVVAGNLSLRELHHPQDALRLYRAAQRSTLLNADLVPQVEQGILDAKAAIPGFSGDERRAKTAVAGQGSGGGINDRSSWQHSDPIVFGVSQNSNPHMEVTPTKPASWGKLDAPPVWGHGAKGDVTEKPDFKPDRSEATHE